jgi:tocopherol cyclase
MVIKFNYPVGSHFVSKPLGWIVTIKSNDHQNYFVKNTFSALLHINTIYMNALYRWRAIWQPEMYHGWGRTQNYFEGWYYKIIDARGQNALAIIPGISMDAEGKKHAFIQVMDGIRCEAVYHHFEASDFRPDSRRFALQLGPNFFDSGSLQLDLPSLKADLRLDNPTPWPKMLGAPGIMGWFGFVPFMECYHGVVSLYHTLSGHLNLNGEDLDFTGGIGYIEKDWGTSFPQSWIWLQSNHFDTPNPTSLLASVARIPFLGRYFVGYIVGFYWEGKLYRFATYTGAKMKAQLGGKEVILAFKDGKYRLEIVAQPGPGANLISPISGEMTGKVNESIQAKAEVRFYRKDQLLFSGTGHHAGLEVAGPVDQLLCTDWRR